MPDGPIFVAGHRGMVGSALVRALRRKGHNNLILRARSVVDLGDSAAVNSLFAKERPSTVFLAAAKVGGIGANNSYRWDFLYDNLRIETSVIGACLEHNVERLVFFGSSCIYPRLAPQPIREEYLLTGPLEPTNEPYAIAKIAGLKLVETANAQHGRQWLSLMPTNLYGPGDNFDLERSHVLPAMIRKFSEAADRGEEQVVLWGSGTPRREFMHVDDLAAAALHLNDMAATGLYNVGVGVDATIAEVAAIVARVVGFSGSIRWDTTRPDGTPRKLLDVSRLLSTGWHSSITLEAGVLDAYRWFRERSAAEVQ